MADGVQIEGLARVVRDLQRLGLDVDDLKGAFGDIARLGANVASSFAPRRTGTLAASIRGNRAKGRATVSAGGGRLAYAGVINYGWAARGIAAAGFMQRADDAVAPKAPDLLIKAINQAIVTRGLQ